MLSGVGDLLHRLKLRGSCMVITDGNVGPLYLAACRASLQEAGFTVNQSVVPPGEGSKDGTKVFDLYDEALEVGLDRKSFFLALGGGVVGDLTGFVAATFLRGVPYVQIPTTLLAMVDSSVGGKTGVNLRQGKNLVGSFHQPLAVLVDLDTLDTLPVREFNAGMAEVIKYGVIWDAGLFNTLEANVEYLRGLDKVILDSVVTRCCEIKADVVREDERETNGLREILNFGHTIGHAIEAVAGYGRFLHGEALAIGMVFAAQLSVRLTGFAPEDCTRLSTLLQAFDLPVRVPDLEWKSIRMAIAHDKKSVHGIPHFVLAEELGIVQPGCEVTESLLKEVWIGCCQ